MAKRKLSFSFLPIPEEIMRSKALSDGAKLLFGIIAKTNFESVKLSKRHLSERMRCGLRETQRRIKELRENNFIIVIPHKGRTNEYQVNLELIQIIQTPDEMTRGQSGLGGETKSTSHIIKKTIKETSKEGNGVAILRGFFIEKCKKLKGFEPEMAFGKEGRLLKQKLKRYSVEKLKDLITKFFKSRIGENLGYTLSICLSASVINQWLAGNLEKPKKPTFRGCPMRKRYDKWEVLENGRWLEFAGREEEIIYK